MYPILFKLGPLQVTSFGFMMAVGFLVSAWILRKELARNKLDPELSYELIMAAAIGGVLGSKLNFLLTHLDAVRIDPFGMIFSGAGLVWYGGLIGGTFAVMYWAKKHKLSVGFTAGLMAPLLALGQGIGRIGCFLVGDDWGKASSVPWAMSFPNGIDPVSYPVHPTQLYEMTALFIIFGIMWVNRNKIQTVWMPFWIYLVLSGIQRFIIEFYRKNTPVLGSLTLAQVTSIVLFLIGSYSIYKIYENKSPKRAAAKQN